MEAETEAEAAESKGSVWLCREGIETRGEGSRGLSGGAWAMRPLVTLGGETGASPPGASSRARRGRAR